MTLKLNDSVIISSPLGKFELPKINTKKLTDFKKWQKVNENNLKIYRDKLKTINAPLNFLNQFIRNNLDNRSEEWLEDRTTLTAIDLTKELSENDFKRRQVSKILWIELKIVEKENKILGWKKKSLDIKAKELKNIIFNKIGKLHNDFLILTETSCKNFPLNEKDLNEDNLEWLIEKNKNVA